MPCQRYVLFNVMHHEIDVTMVNYTKKPKKDPQIPGYQENSTEVLHECFRSDEVRDMHY